MIDIFIQTQKKICIYVKKYIGLQRKTDDHEIWCS